MSAKPAKKAPAAPATVAEILAPAVVVSDAPAAPPKTAKIVFLRSHPGFGNWPGDTADVEAVAAAALVAEGFARNA